MAHKSQQEMAQHLISCLAPHLDSLHNVWDEIGIHGEQREQRTEVVKAHLHNLLDEMVGEEINLKEKLKQNVKSFGEDIQKIRNELALDDYNPPTGFSFLRLEKELRTELEKLEKEKHSRLKSLKRLNEKDQHLCDALCTTPYYIPTGCVPSLEQLDTLEKHIATLQAEKEQRHGTYVTTKKQIVAILDELGHTPNTTFERDIVCEEEDSFLLSTENMQALKMLHEELEIKQQENKVLTDELRERMTTLWERLLLADDEREDFNKKCVGYKMEHIEMLREEIERCEKLKLQHMKRFVEGVRKELLSWWDKSYFSQDQRNEFTSFNNDNYSEDLLDKHDMEVTVIKAYYEKNKDILEKIEKREKLWTDMLESERRAKDVNRFTNRGGNLLKEEQARKKILKDLPKVEDKLKLQLQEWEASNGKQFLMYGKPFTDHVEQQWQDFHAQKENEKLERHKAKEREMQEEMIYGSKPTTPAKRRFLGTQTRTPNKIRKLNETKTPMSVTRSASRLTTPRSVSRLATPRSVSRLATSRACSSPALRPPRTPAIPKTPKNVAAAASPKKKRKALAEKNEDAFSHTTLSSGSSTSSVASAATYQDFSHGLNANGKANCRSSVAPNSYARVTML